MPQGEVGEIVIRGHNIMKGYWQRPDATEEAMRGGWFHSGDMARIDEDGYFFIVDRKKDLIIRGGYNVYPREVEEVLYEHPKIREAAVVGVPHDEWGEEIGAAVVLHEGEELAPEEVSAYVKERIAAYKYPRLVWFLDDLPKGPTGKILKREIETPFASKRVRPLHWSGHIRYQLPGPIAHSGGRLGRRLPPRQGADRDAQETTDGARRGDRHLHHRRGARARLRRLPLTRSCSSTAGRSSASTWNTMTARFEKDGYPKSQLQRLQLQHLAIEQNAAAKTRVKTAGRSLLKATGATKVDIIAHSMGSLNSRWYIKFVRRRSERRRLGLARRAQPRHRLRESSASARRAWRCGLARHSSTELNAGDETPGAVNYGTWWSPCDEIINPDSSVPAHGATNTKPRASRTPR